SESGGMFQEKVWTIKTDSDTAPLLERRIARLFTSAAAIDGGAGGPDIVHTFSVTELPGVPTGHSKPVIVKVVLGGISSADVEDGYAALNKTIRTATRKVDLSGR